MIFGGVLYAGYTVWSVILLVILPSPDPALQYLVGVGSFSAMIGVGAFLLLGGVGLMRLMKHRNVHPQVRIKAFVRLGLIALPGLLLSVAIPPSVTREPPLVLEITNPTLVEDLVAPLSVTFSAERSVELLRMRGVRPEQFSWDFNGDGNAEKDTVVPTVTAVYQREGVYAVTARARMRDGTSRVVARRLIIPKAVFSLSPNPPIVDEPIIFSIAHLVEDPKMVKEIQWDFDGDGNTDEVTKEMDISHAFYRTGRVTVAAVVLLTNQAQLRYERSMNVVEPEPLPFPVTFFSEPQNLIGSPPFGTIFRVETTEPVKEIVWFFGDGEEAEGARVAHTFRKRGVFPVEVEVRSLSGTVAELSKVVEIVDPLSIADLRFDGTPEVQGGRKIIGEVPLTVNLRPRTSLPLIDFMWEAPEATEVGSTDEMLQVVYRREGSYTITLIGQDPEGNVMRLPITVEVIPPSSALTIRTDPEGGVAPLLVRFDASESFIPGETITGFEWEFGDRTGVQFGGARVEHRYALPGTYVTQLTVRTADGRDTKGERTVVVRAPALKACILPSRTTGTIPLGISFSSRCSIGKPIRIIWDFGDGAQSDEAEPVHVFEEAGTYSVKLTIYDEVGNISEQLLTITALP